MVVSYGYTFHMLRADCVPISGRDSIISALHWGPLPEADGFYKTSGQHQVRRTDYASAFHTFGVEWSEDYLFTYIDSRLLVRTYPWLCATVTFISLQ